VPRSCWKRIKGASAFSSKTPPGSLSSRRTARTSRTFTAGPQTPAKIKIEYHLARGGLNIEGLATGVLFPAIEGYHNSTRSAAILEGD